MITPILEKLLLNGKAKNKLLNFGWGSFAKIEVPSDSFIVVHRIFWHPAINQKFQNITDMTWKDFFRFNEFNLKIQNDKESPMNYFLRNEVDFQDFGYVGIGLNGNIDPDYYDKFLLMRPKRPVIFDTFVTAYTSLNLTLTRSALLEVITSSFAPVTNYAEEKPSPNGVDGQNILLAVNFTGLQGTQTTYQPPRFPSTNVPLNGTDTESYLMNYDTNINPIGDNGSFLNNPDQSLGGQLPKSEFATNPLITLEYCVVQKNNGGLLSGL